MPYSYGGVPFNRRGNELFDSSGRNVGRFQGDKIYSPSGRYVGEIHSGKLAKSHMHVGIGPPSASSASAGFAAARTAATVLPAGWSDFTGD